jgi:hypothetical protein
MREVLRLAQDFKQLLTDRVCIVKQRDNDTLESFLDKYRFPPKYYIDFQALTGTYFVQYLNLPQT